MFSWKFADEHTWKQNATDHPWHDHDEHWKYFDVACEDGSTLGMRKAFSRKGTLYNHLFEI